MILSFKASKLPQQEIYTVHVNPMIDSDLEGQKKVIGTPLKITFKIR
jgi:hypothetical protein